MNNFFKPSKKDLAVYYYHVELSDKEKKILREKVSRYVNVVSWLRGNLTLDARKDYVEFTGHIIYNYSMEMGLCHYFSEDFGSENIKLINSLFFDVHNFKWFTPISTFFLTYASWAYDLNMYNECFQAREENLKKFRNQIIEVTFFSKLKSITKVKIHKTISKWLN